MTVTAPFWRYFGGKWRLAPRYPRPHHDTIIEPFAGAAGYSLRYADRNVVLVERYEVVADLWDWLIGASPADVMRIPCVENVDELPSWVPSGARALVGFSMSSAVPSPRKSLSAGKRKMAAMGRRFEGWNEAQRERVASNVDAVSHWKIIHGDWRDAPDVEATWFVDPPYQEMGKHYPHGSSAIDYDELGEWCRVREGQTIVCENAGANWLPFDPFVAAKAGPARRVSHEVVWIA